MIDFDDYFGGLTEEEYVKQTEEHFKFLKEMSKCCMAGYCRYSAEDKYCVANDEIVEKCPYVRAIQEITLLSMELTETYDN